jgi:hypothetical protein
MYGISDVLVGGDRRKRMGAAGDRFGVNEASYQGEMNMQEIGICLSGTLSRFKLEVWK